MILWLVFALMTAVAVLAVAWPLARGIGTIAADKDGDVAVYRDQIVEIERDRESGMIGAAEAEAARLEVSRRLIAAAEGASTRLRAPEGSWVTRHRLAAACALLAVPVGAIALYLALGSPNLPGEPLGARIAEAHGGDQSIEALFAKVEAHLAQHADDGRGWEVIAPVYMRVGRYDDAARARANALRLLGATADREADLGEALVAAGNGIVTADAKAAFDAAIGMDSGNVTARFYEGLAAEQDGNRGEAARMWHALLDAAPPGAQWVGFVRRALARVEASDSADTAVAAAAQSPDAQDQMIRGMVERLAARLHQDGSDVDGWVRLVRSYKVLGEPENIQSAVADARRALANDSDKLRRFDEELKRLEVDAQAPVAPAASPSAAAAGSTPSGQEEMIRGMVERLAARLRRDGSDIEGWIQLVRSYKVLGESEKMRSAIADAKLALTSDSDKLRRLDEGLKSFEAQPTVAALSAVQPADARAAPSDSGVDPMVRGMVDRLDARLRRDGSDVEGWIQLVRSYKVLGEVDRMRAAIVDAQRALAGDSQKLHRLEEGVKSIGIKQLGAPPAFN